MPRRSTSPSSPRTPANLGAKRDRRLLRDDARPRSRRSAPRSRRQREPRAPLEFSERELVEALGEEQRETALAKALREGEFVVSVQLDPPLGGSARGLLEIAHELREGGVTFVDVNDNATRAPE